MAPPKPEKRPQDRIETRKILGATWTVAYTTDPPYDRDADCVPAQHQISINSKTPVAYQEENEIHETFHALISSSYLFIRLRQIHPDLEEEIVETLAPLWYCYLRDNKKRYDNV